MQRLKPTQSEHAMGRLAGAFYADKRLIVLTVLLAVASGLSSLMVLPRMEDPLLTPRACSITTVYPGADAARVEALVTEKIEDQLIDSPEIKRMRSQSLAGSSFISVELRDDIYDTGPVWSAIRGKLEDSISSLPAGASRPKFNELDIAAYAWIGAIVWNRDEPVSNGVLRRLARELKDELFLIDGSKDVDLFGDPREEISVELDPHKLTAAGLSAAQVAQQIRSRDIKVSAGVLHGDNSETVVQLENQFNSLEDILSATIESGTAGNTLQLADVATVRRTTPEPPDALAIVDGKRGIVVSAMLRPEYRIDQWAAAAEPMLESFRKRLPRGVRLELIMQQDAYVAQRMETLARNLLLGVSAVAFVTFLFMGWRSSLLVTATLPVAALMVIAGMRFLGIPIHQMSITGLIIAMGLLIDNAIIAADEIDISLRRGFPPQLAVSDMVSRLFAPLLASTITTALAFAPIALMEGPAGEFVGSIAITVMLAIFSSLFLALTVLPASAALLGKGLSKSEKSQAAGNGKHASFIVRIFHHGISIALLTQVYTRVLRAMFSRPLVGIGVGCVLPICGFWAATQLNEQFFPPADRDQFYIEVELEPQATLQRTAKIAKRIDEALQRRPRVQHTTWFLGESAPPFYYNIIARRKNNPNYGQAIVTLDSNRASLALIRDLQIELDQEFPEARILVRQLEQGPPFDAPVEIRLLGADLDRLKSIGEEMRTLATNIPDVLHTRAALSNIRPVASVAVNSREASWAGLPESEIANQLNAKFDGLFAGTIVEQVEEIPVRVRIVGERRDRIESLEDASLLVNSPVAGSRSSGNRTQPALLAKSVPVTAISEVSLEPQRASITRYNGRRVNEVQCFITAGTLPSKVLNEFKSRLALTDLDQLPAGYRLEVGGEASERDAAVGRLMANVSILAVAMVGALVLALKSFRLAGLIGLVATLSIGLGMGALWLFGYPFGFMAIVGTMGLIGIAINDSIVVVAALATSARVRAGDIEATVETTVEVTRHVLATTATTVVGFLPLVIGGGGFWPPLAVAIGTGVAGATIISLTLVPCVFRLISTQATPSPS
ncbi:MAG: efflux RND transporter permease subunit [Pirellulaceae bacterium]